MSGSGSATLSKDVVASTKEQRQTNKMTLHRQIKVAARKSETEC